jgi:uncharacterized membrane protein SirB2
MRAVKDLHIVLACITVIGFVARFLLHMLHKPLADARWIRTLPHAVDTLLLGLGVSMAIQLSISPMVHAWLMAKIVALLAYIGFGVLALRASTTRGRWTGFTGALLSVGYIFAVALTKQALPI